MRREFEMRFAGDMADLIIDGKKRATTRNTVHEEVKMVVETIFKNGGDESNTRYFVKYKNNEPMCRVWIQNEKDGEYGLYNAQLTPIHIEMCNILIEQGWTEVDLITEYKAHDVILKAANYHGDPQDYGNMWRVRVDECKRRRKEGDCITYPDLWQLAKKRLREKQGNEEMLE